MNVLKFFSNPFEHIAGGKALLLGSALALIAALLAAYFNARFDGALDLHFVEGSTFYSTLMDQIINLIVLSSIFYIGALLAGARFTRFLDVIGTFSIAKSPFLLLPALNFRGHLFRIGENLIESSSSLAMADWALFISSMIVMLLVICWSVYWLFQGFKISSNLKGFRLITTFFICIILSEIISKVLIFSINH
jgi:hypothetical protein